MKVLVTGGAGFIGSHLTAELIDLGHSVCILDNLSTGKLENLAGLTLDFIEGNVADFEAVKTAVQDCELVFHQAALVSVPMSVEQPRLNHDSNVTGSFNVFEAARLVGVKRVVYASSAAVYGDLPKLPKQENDPVAPMTPYAMAKRTSELIAETYAQIYELDSVGLRYMNVFGPRQDPSSPYSGVLSIFCQKMLANQDALIFGDGEQTRDFIFVKDVVRANLLAGFSEQRGGGGAAIFNVGNGVQTSLNQIVQMLNRNGRSFKVTHKPQRLGDIRHSVADISKIQTALGFVPETAVSDGLSQTLDWFQESYSTTAL